MSDLQPTTPLGQAIVRLFSRAAPLLEGRPAGSLKVYIFGGCAVHLLTHARGSADIDAEIEAAKAWRRDEVIPVFLPPEGYEVDGRDLQVVLDLNYSTTLGPLHEDYKGRAIPLAGFERHHALQVFVASGVDLAISKLGRFTDHDRSDIELLIASGRVDTAHFVMLAEEAIDYAVGNRSGMLSCLRMVTAQYLEDAPDVARSSQSKL